MNAIVVERCQEVDVMDTGASNTCITLVDQEDQEDWTRGVSREGNGS